MAKLLRGRGCTNGASAEDRSAPVSESESRPDRGVVTVETRGYKQDGTMVCIFRRRVMVPKQEFAGPENPSFPTPATT